uniref:Protein kinase domain-containing protein n=1 Tax=Pyrodinium bahamense TaxID=73915 RepID=A0A7S0A4E1_9DINO
MALAVPKGTGLIATPTTASWVPPSSSSTGGSSISGTSSPSFPSSAPGGGSSAPRAASQHQASPRLQSVPAQVRHSGGRGPPPMATVMLTGSSCSSGCSPAAQQPLAQQQPQPGSGDSDPERYTPGMEVAIGSFRFRCSGVLGRGSFSEVWAGEVINSLDRKEVALKDISCHSQVDLQQALLEANLLERFQSLATARPAPPGQQAQPVMRIPQYLAHRVDRQRGGWRVRMAMTRVPGESLDSFLRRPPPPGQDGPSSVRRGCALASQFIRQLGPTLERIAPHAWHRDVNSHNVLMSDAIDGGRPRVMADLEETSRRASFWLIDFGLAVDSSTWPLVWPHSDVAGDCRYWPPSSFLMSFYGPEEMTAHQDLCNQYKTRLDIVGLGLTALEILCATALASSYAWGPDGLRGSWRRLFTTWQRYREEVTRWHTMIFQVFSTGGDIAPLYQQLGQEQVVDKVTSHLAKVRSLLRACTQRTEDLGIQRLLGVLADMIDERSSMGLREVVEALGPEVVQAPAPRAVSQVLGVRTVSYTPPPQVASHTPGVHTVSYTPPSQAAAQVAGAHTVSYTPPPQATLHTPKSQTTSYTPSQVVASYTPPAMQATPPRILAAPIRGGAATPAKASVACVDQENSNPQLQWQVPGALAKHPARPAKLHTQDSVAKGVGTAKGAALPYTRIPRPYFAGA